MRFTSCFTKIEIDSGSFTKINIDSQSLSI